MNIVGIVSVRRLLRVRDNTVPYWLCHLSLVCMLLACEACAVGQRPEIANNINPGHVSADSVPIDAGDAVSVHVFDAPELDQTNLRVTDAGQVPLLLLGSVKIAGLTPADAAQVIEKAYSERELLRNPHVAVTIDGHSSSAVTVFGYVVGMSVTAQTTGISIPLSAPTPLLTVLARAGGLSERASRTVTVQRRDTSILPFRVVIPNDPRASLINETIIYPGDTVIVPRAGIVYVLGNVGHPTGVVMEEDGRLSIMEALSQAGSPLPTARMSNIVILRKADGKYTPLHVNFGKIVKGKEPDVQLMAEDVIWVPFSMTKNLMVNGAAIASAVGGATATGLIYTR